MNGALTLVWLARIPISGNYGTRLSVFVKSSGQFGRVTHTYAVFPASAGPSVHPRLLVMTIGRTAEESVELALRRFDEADG